jgi:hypothetical protein
MTRRQRLQSAAAAALPVAASAAPPRVMKNMGSATPGLGARVRAARDAGQEFDIIEYCRDKGLGAPHTYLRGAFDRDALRTHLRERGIPTDVHYPIPDHRQRANPADWLALGLSVTERLAAEVVTLPCFPEMTDAEVETVIAGVNTWRL